MADPKTLGSFWRWGGIALLVLGALAMGASILGAVHQDRVRAAIPLAWKALMPLGVLGLMSLLTGLRLVAVSSAASHERPGSDAH